MKPYNKPNKRLPDFEIYSESGDEFTKAAPCILTGLPLSKYASSNHALLDVAIDTVYVQLPKHRVFLRVRNVGKRIEFEEVTGLVQVPNTTTIKRYNESYLSDGSIVEIDFQHINKDSYFIYPNDINNYFVPPNTYLLMGQLVAYRGNKVTSIGYAESLELFGSIGPNISKISDLPPIWRYAEQEYLSIMQRRNSTNAPSEPGKQLLKVASTIRGGNRFLIRT